LTKTVKERLAVDASESDKGIYSLAPPLRYRRTKMLKTMTGTMTKVPLLAEREMVD
jgi:hypothetical protein